MKEEKMTKEDLVNNTKYRVSYIIKTLNTLNNINTFMDDFEIVEDFEMIIENLEILTKQIQADIDNTNISKKGE